MAREKRLGNRYAILRQPGTDELMKTLIEVATAASEGRQALPALLDAMMHADAAVRYWGATGVGNIGEAARSAETEMTAALKDDAVSVRVAAAQALCRMSKPERALPVLKAELAGEHQWARLQAAIVLDEIGEMARPAEDALKKALSDQPNKYITRVANRALNDLNGTNNTVP
jgi:uncharacterized sulfatase